MDETAIVTINGGNLDHLHHQHQHQRRPTKTRTRTSPFNIIRAALFMLRRPSSASKSPARISSKPFWKSLVVAVRPLHHQPHHSPINRPPHPLLPKADSFKEAQSPVALLSEPSSARSLDREQDSVYASAQNLQELDKSSSEQDIDDDDDYGQDNINGDEMIDSKAEDFIAHFYAQMRLQRLESMERYNAKNSIKIN